MNIEWGNESIAALVGSIFGGGFGWLAAWIESRKSERLLLLRELDNSLEELQLNCSGYWNSEGRDESTEQRIKSGFDRVDSKLRLLSTRKIVGPEIANSLGAIWVTATEGEFEVKKRRKDTIRARKLRKAFLALREELIPLN